MSIPSKAKKIYSIGVICCGESVDPVGDWEYDLEVIVSEFNTLQDLCELEDDYRIIWAYEETGTLDWEIV